MADTNETPSYKEGDQLAFRKNFGGWAIRTIRKVTPSGRLVFDNMTLNPDLSVRGQSFSGPSYGQPITDEIRAEVNRGRNLSYLSNVTFSDFSDDFLTSLVDLIKGEDIKILHHTTKET